MTMKFLKTRIACTIAALLLGFCSSESPLDNTSQAGIVQPQLHLCKALSLAEISSAEAVISGTSIPEGSTFPLTLLASQNKLKGTIKIPQGVTFCIVTIFLYDANDHKIGQGTDTLTETDITAGFSETPVIGIGSAKPRVDTLSVSSDLVNVGETVTLHAAVSDSFGGTITTYEWKCGDGPWAEASGRDTNIVAPLSAQMYSCSLRVTDDDGNQVSRSLVLNVSQLLYDADGNRYPTATIGTQVWTAANWYCSKFKDGTAIPLVQGEAEWSNLSSSGYCFHSFVTHDSTQRKHGALYNWYAVNSGKLGPEGWHVATDADWQQLEVYLAANNLGGSSALRAQEWGLAAITIEGVDTIYTWSAGGTNETGFSAYTSGYRTVVGEFDGFLDEANFWTATAASAGYAVNRVLFGDRDIIEKNDRRILNGYGVRLVKD